MIWPEGITRQIALEIEDGSSSYSAKGDFRYFYSKIVFFYLSGQSHLQLQVDTSEGFGQHVTLHHKLCDHLQCHKLHAYTRLTVLDRFACCAHGKQYQLKQILIFDLVKPVFLIQKHHFVTVCLKRKTFLQALAPWFCNFFVPDGLK